MPPKPVPTTPKPVPTNEIVYNDKPVLRSTGNIGEGSAGATFRFEESEYDTAGLEAFTNTLLNKIYGGQWLVFHRGDKTKPWYNQTEKIDFWVFHKTSAHKTLDSITTKEQYDALTSPDTTTNKRFPPIFVECKSRTVQKGRFKVATPEIVKYYEEYYYAKKAEEIAMKYDLPYKEDYKDIYPDEPVAFIPQNKVLHSVQGFEYLEKKYPKCEMYFITRYMDFYIWYKYDSKFWSPDILDWGKQGTVPTIYVPLRYASPVYETTTPIKDYFNNNCTAKTLIWNAFEEEVESKRRDIPIVERALPPEERVPLMAGKDETPEHYKLRADEMARQDKVNKAERDALIDPRLSKSLPKRVAERVAEQVGEPIAEKFLNEAKEELLKEELAKFIAEGKKPASQRRRQVPAFITKPAEGTIKTVNGEKFILRGDIFKKLAKPNVITHTE